ncbi:short-chain dehydrogenase [Streptomyces sp. PRh5]|uniref:SDR family oxidoreductase n=1 Tax=Streptomyces sp. PRh5 TaxID=1158056 RepID=UPI000449F0E2|nr:SDR family oxidoreductase [Streptomyces sp. PRh5]EXU65814.1 short-chain dehydrogenase [Streptomyces sp. PRh5]
MTGLIGKTALVTGASRGIGRYTAQRLARDGARVGVHYGKNEQAAHEVVESIRTEGGEAFALHADLAAPHAAQTLWEAFDRHADGVDILVNNAGMVVYGSVTEVVEEDFDQLFAVNVKAPLFIIQHGLLRLRDGGRIINLSSAAAYLASPMATMYALTKGAISTLTRTVAWDLGNRHITVNAVAPGFTDTDMSDWFADPAAKAWAASQNTMSRVGQPEDIGDIIAFLASDDARWVNGQVIDATGGGLLGVTRTAE